MKQDKISDALENALMWLGIVLSVFGVFAATGALIYVCTVVPIYLLGVLIPFIGFVLVFFAYLYRGMYLDIKRDME